MKTVRDCLPPGVKYYSNRSDAEAAGIKLPPYDPKRPKQLWTARADGSYDAYKFIDKAGQPLSQHAALPPVSASGNPLVAAFLGNQGVAFGLNIPGPTKWVDWDRWMLTQASSGVTVTFSLFGGDKSLPVGKDALFTKAQADAVASVAGGVAVEATDWNGQKAVYTYPEGELRKVWSIQKGGKLLALSAVWRQMTEGAGHGIGSPGHFNEADGALIWISEGADLGDGPNVPEVPPPSRELEADEEVALVAMSGVPTLVVRTKGESPAPATPTTGGGLSAADAQKLNDVWLGVKMLVERMGG